MTEPKTQILGLPSATPTYDVREAASESTEPPKREAEGQWRRMPSIVVNDEERHSRLNGLL